MTQCPRCKSAVDRATVRVSGTFPCAHCGASLAVDATQLWRRRALYGVLAGVLTGALQATGGALFALCIALAVSLADARIGSLRIVETASAGTKPLSQSLWTSVAVAVFAAVPYALLRALLS